MTPALDQALALYRRGLSVIPVPPPRPNCAPGSPGDGKVPAIPWKDFQDRLPTEAEVRASFATPMNIAIVTGTISGVVVVDADSPEALAWCVRRLPRTPWQTKTARGFHLFYRHPGGRVPNRAHLDTRDGRLAIDMRGDGGYVIAPGSIHATGTRYTYAGDWSEPRESLPIFWPGWLARPRRSDPEHLHAVKVLPNSLRRDAPILERARKYLAAIPSPEIGAGSDVATLSAACRLVRGFALSAADAEDLLWDWAGGRPGWDRRWIAEKVAHAERYGTEPIGALL